MKRAAGKDEAGSEFWGWELSCFSAGSSFYVGE
jgi:hypothetical protein